MTWGKLTIKIPLDFSVFHFYNKLYHPSGYTRRIRGTWPSLEASCSTVTGSGPTAPRGAWMLPWSAPAWPTRRSPSPGTRPSCSSSQTSSRGLAARCWRHTYTTGTGRAHASSLTPDFRCPGLSTATLYILSPTIGRWKLTSGKSRTCSTRFQQTVLLHTTTMEFVYKTGMFCITNNINSSNKHNNSSNLKDIVTWCWLACLSTYPYITWTCLGSACVPWGWRWRGSWSAARPR